MNNMDNDIISIKLTHQKALKLLLNLEELSLIKVLKKNDKAEEKLSDKYAGKLSADIAEQLQQHVSKSREEWERNI